MGVMDLDHEIGDRELQLMHPELRGLGLRHKAMAATQIEQDVGDLREHELAGSEEWRRKRWRAGLRLQQFRHRSHAARLASDVAIGSPDLFQSQPDVFAAALDGGPVVKLVTHETVLAIRRRSYDPSLSIPRQNKEKGAADRSAAPPHCRSLWLVRARSVSSSAGSRRPASFRSARA